nr:Asd/ArgC dimerization domain-containing protein [Angustibacter aerolatus]
MLAPLHRAAGLTHLRVAAYQAVSGSGGKGVAELDEQVRKVADSASALAFDGRAVEPARAEPLREAHRVQRAAARRLDRRRRVAGDRRGAEAPQREPQDPARARPAGVGDLRAGAGLHRAQHGGARRVRAADLARAGHRACCRARPASSLSDVPTPLDAAGRDPSLVGRIRADQSVDDGRGLVFFVSNDNLRKGAALNAVQIAEALLTQRFGG